LFHLGQAGQQWPACFFGGAFGGRLKLTGEKAWHNRREARHNQNAHLASSRKTQSAPDNKTGRSIYFDRPALLQN
jgi:hypothetical protein